MTLHLPLTSDHWSEADLAAGRHSSWPSKLRAQRYRLPSGHFGQCPGFFTIDSLESPFPRHVSCGVALDRFSTALCNEGISLFVCTTCYRSSYRAARNVWLLHQYHYTKQLTSKPCITCSLPLTLTNASVFKSSSRSVRFASQCTSCSSKQQASKKRTVARAFLRSRVDHLKKRCRRFPNEAVNWSARKFDIPLQLTSLLLEQEEIWNANKGGIAHIATDKLSSSLPG